MQESAPAEIVEFTEPRIIFGSQGEDSLQPIAEKALRSIAARLAASVLLDALDLRGRDLEHNEACIMMALRHVAVVSRWREMRNLCILRTQEVGSRVQGSLRFVTLCYAIALMSLPSR